MLVSATRSPSMQHLASRNGGEMLAGGGLTMGTVRAGDIRGKAGGEDIRKKVTLISSVLG